MSNTTIPGMSNTWTPANMPIDAFGEAGSSTQPVGLGSAKFNLWHAINGAVSVKAYGAKVDGVTDDTIAVQAAVNAESSVFFPAGICIITQRILVPSYRKLFGMGRDVSILKQTTLPSPGSVPNSATLYDNLVISGSYVEISDMWLLGPATGTLPTLLASSLGQKCLSIQPYSTSANITLTNLRVTQAQANGIQIWNGVTNVSAFGVEIRSCGNEGFFIAQVGTGYIRVQSLVVTDVQTWGFDTNAGNVLVDGFVIQRCGNTTNPNDCGGMTWSCTDTSTYQQNVSFINGNIDNCLPVGVLIVVPETATSRRGTFENITVGNAGDTVTRAALLVDNAGTRTGLLLGASIRSIRGINSYFGFKSCGDVDLVECSAINLGSTPSADIRGFNVDVGLSTEGVFRMTRCTSVNWYRGMRWQSVTRGISMGNECRNNAAIGIDINSVGVAMASTDDFGSSNAGLDFYSSVPAKTKYKVKFTFSATPGTVAAGGVVGLTVGCPASGWAFGMSLRVAGPGNNDALIITANVVDGGHMEVVFFNPAGGPVTAASGTYTVIGESIGVEGT